MGIGADCLPATHALSTSDTHGPRLFLSYLIFLAYFVSIINKGMGYGDRVKVERHTLERNPSYDEAFLRAYTIPVEDWHWVTRAKWCGGFRWFRSPNIVPIEKYQRPTTTGDRRAA